VVRPGKGAGVPGPGRTVPATAIPACACWNKELVGIISQDLAAKLPEDKVGELAEAISSISQ
jgi:hypothetical protein